MLSGLEIQRLQTTGDIIISPFNPKQIGPNSYNVKLDNTLLQYDNVVLDMKRPNPFTEITIPEDGLIIQPGVLYLGSTVEIIQCSPNYQAAEQAYTFGVSGRCHGRGTQVRMYDGSLKNVEDIVVGDEVMGIESIPAKVTSIHRGQGDMFLVKQSKGISYTVNQHHLLSLVSLINTTRFKRGQIYNISVEDYLTLPAYEQEYLKGFRLPVEYGEKEVLIDPYVLGVWLGDGTSSDATITLFDNDPEIAEYIIPLYPEAHLRSHSDKNCRVLAFSHKGGIPRNPIIGPLREYNLIKNKHIPQIYKHAPLSVRRELFAGLIDTDGYHSGFGVEFVSTNEQLAYDVQELAFSLGLNAKMNIATSTRYEKSYGNKYRIYVTGDFTGIKYRCARKMSLGFQYERTEEKRFSTLTIEPIGRDEYFGFELDNPTQMYFLKDNTVTHNSSIGRLGISVHATAGFGDVGFGGRITYEISCVQPVKIYPWVEIAQIYFYPIEGEVTGYHGKYQDNDSAQPSMMYKDFE